MRLLALMDLECSSQLSREMLEGDFTGPWCSSRPAYNGSWPPSQATVDTSGNKYMQVLRTILSPGESPHLEILQRWLNQRQTKVGIQKSRPLSSRWGPLLEPWILQSSPRIWRESPAELALLSGVFPCPPSFLPPQHVTWDGTPFVNPLPEWSVCAWFQSWNFWAPLL